MTTYYVDVATGNDANAGTSAGSGNAWMTLQKAFDTAVAGDLVYIKASGTYSEQVDVDTNSGTVTAPIRFEGYTTTPGDGGQFTWDGATYCINTTGKDYIRFRNVFFTGCTSFIIGAQTDYPQYWWFYNCKFTSAATVFGRISGYWTISYWIFDRCIIQGMSGMGLQYLSSHNIIRHCRISDNGSHGIQQNGYSGFALIERNIIANNAGDGVNSAGAQAEGVHILHNSFHDNSDGIDFTGSSIRTMVISGNIFAYHTTGTGLKVGTLSGNSNLYCDHNFFYNNSTNKSGSVDGPNDVILTADPYVNAGADDWNLNNTAGGGAAVRAASLSNIDGTNIDYLDGGALQHADPASGVMPVRAIFQNIGTY